ncbi:hypothetical protein CBLAS_1048 [Campylobacter blaseri]|uniref:Cell filamentation protein Fic n=1 Tax=Campylobacter blaseri TaxID=2042961 RepID=A0A2P8QYJ3_9BACT|nr:hypothetical protein [Campylobacter blaseri]PSM51302.1 hypothetical protein CQ405_08715 [Campylobacter blaseri]PSM52446.1 hypothetical protein CRN67_08720 [Campylobacter blaseri]QKF86225.1 hypothetical protein CBLAS_1048 [Campylobacter blaseri]
MDKTLNFDNEIPENNFDRQLLNSNLIGAKNLMDLNKRERILSSIQIEKLSKNFIKGNFDYQHLKNIHKYIFQDIYDWAEKYSLEMCLTGNFTKTIKFI